MKLGKLEEREGKIKQSDKARKKIYKLRERRREPKAKITGKDFVKEWK
jgi:hypothetical protein